MSEQALRNQLRRLESKFAQLESRVRRTPKRDFVGSIGQIYRVVKPIKPGEAGTGVKMHYSFKQVGDPLEDEGWVEYSDTTAEKDKNEENAVEILDSEFQTLAMPGALVRATFYKSLVRTIGEYGITNVRVKAIAAYGSGIEGEYQVIDGGPQEYDGSPVTIKATLPKSVNSNQNFLFSYDRVAREWYEVETGGGSMRWIIGTALEDVDHLMGTFKASWTEDLVGGPDGYSNVVDDSVEGNEDDPNALLVHNHNFGKVYDQVNTSTVVFEGEEVFALKRGMRFKAFLRDDGDWECVQLGGVLEDFEWIPDAGGGGGGPSPS